MDAWRIKSRGEGKKTQKNTSSFLLGENRASQNRLSYLLFSTQACLGVFSCFLGFLLINYRHMNKKAALKSKGIKL